MKAKEKAELIAHFAAEKKGENIVLLDMSGHGMLYDWFVVVSASSARRINAIAKSIDTGLSSKKIKPISIEGKGNPYWTLLDYEDVVVHVFYAEIRDYYGLERLWPDIPQIHFKEKCLKKTSQKKSQKPS